MKRSIGQGPLPLQITVRNLTYFCLQTVFDQQNAARTVQAASVDYRAAQSVIGTRQSKAFLMMANSSIQKPSHRQAFSFRDGVFESIGALKFRIENPKNTFLQFTIHVA